VCSTLCSIRDRNTPRCLPGLSRLASAQRFAASEIGTHYGAALPRALVSCSTLCSIRDRNTATKALRAPLKACAQRFAASEIGTQVRSPFLPFLISSAQRFAASEIGTHALRPDDQRRVQCSTLCSIRDRNTLQPSP